MRAGVFTIPALLLAGCADCPSFDEMEVFDRDDTADAEHEHDTLFAIQDFARWTGRPGVCVPRVDLVDSLPSGLLGLYRGPGDPIQVKADQPDIRATVLHELGHAIDNEEDHVERFPELFPPAELSPVDYMSDNSRRQETFADTVAQGAVDLDMRQLMADECGVQSTWTDALAYIQAEVYTAKEPSPALSGRTDLVRVDGPELAGVDPDTVLDVAGWNGDLLVLAGEAFREPGPPGSPSWRFRTYRRYIQVVDPATGAVKGGIALPAQADHGWVEPLAWFASTDGLPVVVYTDETTRMYEVDPAEGTVHGLPSMHLPPAVYTPVAIVDAGSQRLAFFESTWDDLPTVHAVDLDSGDELDLNLYQEAWGKTIYVSGFWPMDGRLLMVSYHEGISWYDPTGKQWQTVPVPTWWYLGDPHRIGGHFLLFHTGFDAATDTGRSAPSALFDLNDGTWSVASDPCSAGWDDLRVRAAAEVDGAVWLVVSPRSTEGADTLRLVRFELGDRRTVSRRNGGPRDKK